MTARPAAASLTRAALVGLAVSMQAAAQGASNAPPPPSWPVGTVITDTLWSQALGARKSLVLYLPPSYAANTARRYPVAYYLHGAGGDETNWARLGRIDRAMDSLVAAGMPEMIVAMPDGDDSWYATYNTMVDVAGCRRLLPRGGNAEADCVAWPHYDDYIAFDVVRHVDAKYRTLATRERRAIAGLSMGGYGAFVLALEYPRVFAAAAAHSGVLWPLELAPPPLHATLPHGMPDSAAMASFASRNAQRLRAIFGADSAGWLARDPATLIARRLAAGGAVPPLFADGGTDDPFFAESRAFRDAMRARNVPLDFHEWPGNHDWTYWRTHVPQSLAWLAARIAR